MAFVAMTPSVFAPVSEVEGLTLITMVVAALYLIAGCWMGSGCAVVGVALAALVFGLFPWRRLTSRWSFRSWEAAR